MFSPELSRFRVSNCTYIKYFLRYHYFKVYDDHKINVKFWKILYGWNQVNLTYTSILIFHVLDGVRGSSIARWKALIIADSPFISDLYHNRYLSIYSSSNDRYINPTHTLNIGKFSPNFFSRDIHSHLQPQKFFEYRIPNESLDITDKSLPCLQVVEHTSINYS